jgi:hypothetical protein
MSGENPPPNKKPAFEIVNFYVLWGKKINETIYMTSELLS